MKRGGITISENGVNITAENGMVWMSEHEIARLFGVFVAKVSSNIKSILKSDVLRTDEVCHCYYYANGGSVDLYNLEMITALAFRIHSRNTDLFRKWLMKRACYGLSPLMAGLCNERKINLN
ncbi:protein-tyrosine kinase [Dysgonomonas reticulitermitis]